MTSNLNSAKRQELYSKWEERQKKAGECSHDRVLEELEKKAEIDGWKPRKHTGNEPGIDLELEKGNRIVMIEVQGERPNQKNAIGRVKLALGAIILDIKYEKPCKVYRYCLAFPATEAFKKCEIPAKARQPLGLSIIFVECPTGLLKVLLPDAKDTIDLSNFDELFHAH